MDDTREIFQVNVFSQLAFSQPFITYFRQRKAGHILYVSSLGGIATAPSMSGYGATKAALNAFSEALHAELAPYGVRVTTLLPGYFPSNLLDALEAPLSKVYTMPEQGYNFAKSIPAWSEAQGWRGDVVKFCARVFEIVTGTGIAKEVGLDSENRGISKIVIGSDSAAICGGALEKMLHNIEELRPLWSSTDAMTTKL